MADMASSRKRTAQPFSKGQGARTPSEPLRAVLAGKPLMGANPQNPNRELQKGAAADTPAQAAIRQAARGRAARKLSDALKDRVGGSVPMAGPPKGINPGASLAADLTKPANQSGTRSGSTSSKPKPPVQKTYVSKGEINQTGNERSGKAFSTFTVKGKDGEYHDYGDGSAPVFVPKKKKRTGPAKGL